MNTNFTLDVNIHLPAAVLDFLERLSTGHAVSGPAVQAASVPAPVPVTPVPVAQPAAAPAPVAQPVPAPAPAAAPTTARAFRFEDIQLAATSLCDTGKRAEVLALLAKRQPGTERAARRAVRRFCHRAARTGGEDLMADKFKIRPPYPDPTENKQPVIRVGQEYYRWLAIQKIKNGGLPIGAIVEQCIDFCREHMEGEQHANT